MEAEKRLLFISTRAFWKMDGGHPYVIFHYLRGLHEIYGYRIYVYTFVENEGTDNDAGIPAYVEKVEYAESIRKRDVLKNAFSHMCSYSNPWPLQNMLFYSRRNSERIREFAEEIKPDAVYVDMMRLAPYEEALQGIKCLKVLGYGDLLSERYQRQSRLNSPYTNVAGAYSDRLPAGISRLQRVAFINKAVLRFEAKRMEKSELFYANQYDSGIFVSDIETRKFNKKLGREMAHTVSVGIDYDSQPWCVDYPSVPNSFSYVGNMKTAANYETVIYIMEKIVPRLKIDYRFYVIGTCPEELTERYKDNAKTIFTGKVDNLRPYIKSTSVFFSPIVFGTGIKTKILEAFAMGMPVITNSVGIEGIEAENGKHCIICDDTEELANALEALMQDNDKKTELAKNAQKLARDKYQWEKNWLGFADAGF